MRPVLLPLLFLLPLPALGQENLGQATMSQDNPLPIDLQNDLPYLARAEVAGGVLTVEKVAADGYDARQLMFNGQPVAGVSDRHVDIQAITPLPETEGTDVTFVTVAGGGNACPTLWALVVTSDQGARATAPFGTCSEAILNPRLTEDALIAFDMAPVSDGQGWMTYSFDGHDLRETALPESAQPAAP
ncbi:MAG: hypothetical protein R3D63_00095 [Paracoccaceae bacterium]